MTKVSEILAELTEEQHKSAVMEVKAMGETGILVDGVVRGIARRITDVLGLPESDALTVAQSEIIRQAAYKWASTAKF